MTGEGDNNSGGGEIKFTAEQQAHVNKLVSQARAAGKESASKQFGDYDEMKKQLAELQDKDKSEAEKLRNELARRDKDLKKALEVNEALTSFKTQTELQGLKADRCAALKLPAHYAKYATGSTPEEIDASLKALHTDFGARDIGAGGGGGEGGPSKKSENDVMNAIIFKKAGG